MQNLKKKTFLRVSFLMKLQASDSSFWRESRIISETPIKHNIFNYSSIILIYKMMMVSHATICIAA